MRRKKKKRSGGQRGDRGFWVRGCRHCGSYEMFELPLDGLLEAAFLPPLFLRPFRCNRCLRKQLGFKFIKPLLKMGGSAEELKNGPQPSSE